MPHSLPDSLLPGESLEAGDFLVSDNGLYRLYMEPTGYASLYAYTINTTVDGRDGAFNIRTVLWGVAGGEGSSPGVRLFFPDTGPCELRAADGSVVASIFNLNLKNHRFVVQGNGDLVHYGMFANGSLDAVGSNTAHLATALLPQSYPPETGTVSIQVGQIAASVSDGDLLNGMDKLIGVRDGSQYRGLQPGMSVPVASIAGQIVLESDEKHFLSLSGPIEDRDTLPADAPGSQSADATVDRGELSHTVQSAGRYQIIVTGAFGLSLTDTRRVVPPAFVPPKHLLSKGHGKSYRPE